MNVARVGVNCAAAAWLVALLLGCGADGTSGSSRSPYYSVYQIGGSQQVDGRTAEAALAQSVAASSVGRFDKPVVVLRAPQPAMPPADTEQRVVGAVVVHIHFNEAGLVDKVVPVRSSKDSLLE